MLPGLVGPVLTGFPKAPPTGAPARTSTYLTKTWVIQGSGKWNSCYLAKAVKGLTLPWAPSPVTE